MKTCSQCLYTDQHPFKLFIENDTCSGCLIHKEKYTLDWAEQENKFFNVIQTLKKNYKNYQCIVPVRGDAEDYFVIEKLLSYDLNILVVFTNNYFMNDIGWKNFHNLITYFDVDSVSYNPDLYVYKSLVRESVRKYNHALWPSFALRTSYIYHLALEKKIPLVIYGQNQAIEQVGKFSHHDTVEHSSWSRIEHDLFNVQEKKFINTGSNFNQKDLYYYNFPDIDMLSRNKIRGLYLSNYFPWDPLNQNKKSVNKGFVPQKNYSTFDVYENAGNSIYYNFHDLSKLMRVGYRKIHDHVARELRHKRISTKDARNVIKMYQNNKVYIKDFFEWLDVSTTGYQWFVSQKLDKYKRLISNEPINDVSIDSNIPLLNNLHKGKNPFKHYVAFAKGI